MYNWRYLLVLVMLVEFIRRDGKKERTDNVTVAAEKTTARRNERKKGS